MGVRRVQVDGPGYRRRRAGKGFTYLDCDGARITVDPRVIERFEAGHTVDDEVGRGTDVEAMADDLGVAGTDGAGGKAARSRGDDGADDDAVTVEADLLAEIETAVVDLIEASRRRRRPARRG